MKIGDRFLDGQLTALDEQFVPGQNTKATLILLNSETLPAGTIFEFWEVRKVAQGIVI